MSFRNVWGSFLDALNHEPGAEEVIYDPADLAGVLVLCLTGMGVLYWLLWALLVCEGGIFVKVFPFLQVVFTDKTWSDFGYRGYPYQLGVFEGWVVNLGALALAAGALAFLWRAFRERRP